MDLKKQISFPPNTDVIAVGCLFKERKLMASHGVLVDKHTDLDCEELRISTCRITKVFCVTALAFCHDVNLLLLEIGVTFYH